MLVQSWTTSTSQGARRTTESAVVPNNHSSPSREWPPTTMRSTARSQRDLDDGPGDRRTTLPPRSPRRAPRTRARDRRETRGRCARAGDRHTRHLRAQRSTSPAQHCRTRSAPRRSASAARRRASRSSTTCTRVSFAPKARARPAARGRIFSWSAARSAATRMWVYPFMALFLSRSRSARNPDGAVRRGWVSLSACYISR